MEPKPAYRQAVMEVLDALLGHPRALREEAAAEQRKAIDVIRALFSYYLEHPGEVPDEYARAPGTDADRVADYIAGMTDRYALTTYERLFLPQGWML